MLPERSVEEKRLWLLLRRPFMLVTELQRLRVTFFWILSLVSLGMARSRFLPSGVVVSSVSGGDLSLGALVAREALSEGPSEES